MAISVDPNSTIVLVKTPLENDYKNTFTFNTYANQLSYFNSLPGKQIIGTDYTYIKKDNKIRVGVNYDDIIKFNYLYYDNEGFGESKRYYCFIDKMEYINENCTDIYIQTDVFQTWYFDIEWNRCFVEREHVNDDTIGKHTIPENLEQGENIYANSFDLTTSLGFTYICVSTPSPTRIKSGYVDDSILDSLVYNGVYSGEIKWLFKTASDASKCIRFLSGNSKPINNVYLVPRTITGRDPDDLTKWVYGGPENDRFEYSVCELSNESTQVDEINYIYSPTSIDTYTPKNNKLFTYPYNYFYISNNVGTDVIYRYEDFKDNIPSFMTLGAITPGCSIKTFPLNYKKMIDDIEHQEYNTFNEGISVAKLPICSWESDVYTNWLTQNGLNAVLNVGQNVFAATEGGLMAGLTGGIGGLNQAVSSSFNIANTLVEVYKKSLTPYQTQGNINSGDVVFSSDKINPRCYQCTIRSEYAEIIDNYFSMFGYKVNITKVPNITGRKNWNFIKTIDCNADGDIPQEDLNVIKDSCNRGITFWHTPANIYKYNLDNSIV